MVADQLVLVLIPHHMPVARRRCPAKAKTAHKGLITREWKQNQTHRSRVEFRWQVKTPSHEERAERRANEIDGLKKSDGAKPSGDPGKARQLVESGVYPPGRHLSMAPPRLPRGSGLPYVSQGAALTGKKPQWAPGSPCPTALKMAISHFQPTGATTCVRASRVPVHVIERRKSAQRRRRCRRCSRR